MPAFRLILLFLLAAFSASAQEQQQAAEPQELPAEVAAEFDARLAEVLVARMDAVWVQMFTNSVGLTRDISAKRDDGFDAEGITIPFPQHDVHVVKA